MTTDPEPDWIGQHHPGEVLHEALQERGMTQADLSRVTGLTQKHISQLVRGRIGIGNTAARLIGNALNINPRLFIRMQADYDYTHHRNQRP